MLAEPDVLFGHCSINVSMAVEGITPGCLVRISSKLHPCVCVVDKITSDVGKFNCGILDQESLSKPFSKPMKEMVDVDLSLWAFQSHKVPIAYSIVLRVVDSCNKTISLPRDTSVREHIAHAVKTQAFVSVGFSFVSPAGISGKAVVVRCTPSAPIVRIALSTSVTFDATETETRVSNPSAVIRGSLGFSQLRELLLWPSIYRQTFDSTPRLNPPSGILLHGPPGTGKTSAVYRLAEELSQHCPCLLLTDLGANKEAGLREIFLQARTYLDSSPDAKAIVLLDEVDALCPKRTTGTAEDGRVVAQLLTLLDGIVVKDERLMVVACSNRPNVIDPALRRPGRLEKEISFSPPSATERYEILMYYLRDYCHDAIIEEESIRKLAKKECVGFVGADLQAVVRAAVLDGKLPGKRAWKDALEAMGSASALRHKGFISEAQAPEIKGYAHVQQQLAQTIDWPLLHEESMARLNLSPPRGVLMYGPPGCSKTSLAKSAASRCGFSFITLGTADVYSPFMGEAEKTVREVFANARAAIPAIVFLDELDALVGKRGVEASSVQERILSTLLNEMDGIVSSTGLLVLAATNRVDMIDDALLRPGRFDRLIHVPLPCMEDRVEILRLHASKTPFRMNASSPDAAIPNHFLEDIAVKMEGRSGADIQNLCREAAMNAMRLGRLFMLPSDFHSK